MNSEQLLLQLGISGAVLFVGYRIALVLLRNWQEAEKERTKALADGFTGLVTSLADIVRKVDDHHTVDLESHRELGEQLVEINTKLNVAYGLTPVRGVKAPSIAADAEDTDPESPHALEAQSVPTKPRPPTQGGGTYHLQPAKRRG